MSIKVVMLIQDVTQRGNDAPGIGYISRQHIAGWSEHVWWLSDSITDLVAALVTVVAGRPPLLVSRAGCLADNCNIIGVRLYKGGAGKGQSLAIGTAGNAGSTDIPQMALLCKVTNTGLGVSRRWTIRGIPDTQVAAGEFSPDVAYNNRIAAYFKALENWVFLAKNPVTPTAVIQSISNVGKVTFVTNPQPFVLGQQLRIQKTVDAAGALVSDNAQVSTVGPFANQITLDNWTHGACTKGVIKGLQGTFFAAFDATTAAVSRVVARKVGRPFEQYRGRRSKKKVAL